MNRIISLMLLVLFFINCSKNDETTTVAPTVFTIPETKDIVMYEINIGSFSQAGNLNGIINRLDAIQALGINTIWLMPIHPIGTVNSFGSPYCIKDFRGVNPEIGTLNDLKNLVEQAHERGIAVILDWVANHTAWDHPWITQHPNWYTQDGSGNIVHPPGTNWTDVADLNYNSAAMRSEMIAAMQFWITEAGIDGFRCDAADLVPFDFWQNAIATIQNETGRSLIFLAEGTRNDHFAAGFQMNFSWDYYNVVKNVFTMNGNPSQLYSTNSNEYQTVPSGKKKLRFTTNHDLSNELTPMGVFGSKKVALAASVATIFMNGVPMLYSGQEVGVNNPSIYTTGQTIAWNANADMLAEYKKLMLFYKNSEVAKSGTLQYLNNSNFIIIEKTLGENKLLVIINSRESVQSLSLPTNLQGNWQNVMSNNSVLISANVELNAHDYLILLK